MEFSRHEYWSGYPFPSPGNKLILNSFIEKKKSVGFPGSSTGKGSTCNAGDTGSIPGSGRSTGEGIDYPLQYPWAFLMAQMVRNPPAMWVTGFDPWIGKIPWRREWLPTPVFWPGEFHGKRSLESYGPWGRKESDTTERLSKKYYFIGKKKERTIEASIAGEVRLIN